MPTDPFTPVTCIELSSGRATIYQDGSVTIAQRTIYGERYLPLSKQDIEKLVKALQLFAPHLSKENPS